MHAIKKAADLRNILNIFFSTGDTVLIASNLICCQMPFVTLQHLFSILSAFFPQIRLELISLMLPFLTLITILCK